MLNPTVNFTRDDWQLYDSATEQEVTSLNTAFNVALKAFADQMDTETGGYWMTNVTRKGHVLNQMLSIHLVPVMDYLAHTGSADSEPRYFVNSTVRRMFGLGDFYAAC